MSVTTRHAGLATHRQPHAITSIKQVHDDVRFCFFGSLNPLHRRLCSFAPQCKSTQRAPTMIGALLADRNQLVRFEQRHHQLSGMTLILIMSEGEWRLKRDITDARTTGPCR